MFKKVLSSIIAYLLILGLAAPAMAINIESIELDRFDSFNDYAKDYTDDRVESFPQGYGATSYSNMERAGFVNDEDRFGHVVKLGTGASMLLPLDSIFEAGKGGNGWIHLSFDIKLKSVPGEPTSKNKKFQLLYNSSWKGMIYNMNATNSTTGWINGEVHEGTYEYDVDNAFEVPGDWASNFLTIGADNLGRKMEMYHAGLYNVWNTGSTNATNHFSQEGMTADSWHKLDIYAREADGDYSVYLDGNLVSTYAWNNETGNFSAPGQYTQITPGWWNFGENKVKGFEFRSGLQDDYAHPYENGFPGQSAAGLVNENDGGAFLIDNVHIRFYRTNDDLTTTTRNFVIFDDIAINTDDNGGKGIPTQNGRVAIGFSEWLDRPVTKEDIVVKNIDTHTTVTNFIVENSDNMKCELVFDDAEIENGTYSVTVNNVKGMMSQKSISVGAKFRTSSEKQVVDGLEIEVPRVDDIKCYNWENKIQQESIGISSGTNRVEIDFSAPISLTDISSKVSISCEGEAIDYTPSLKNGGKTLSLLLDGLLKPNKKHYIDIDSGIIASESEGLSSLVTMRAPYNYEFTTMNDGTFKFVNPSIVKSGSNWTASVNAIKTDDEDKKYTVAVGVYEVEGGKKKLVGMEYEAVNINGDKRDIINHTLSGRCRNTSTKEIKLFVVEYPKQEVLLAKGENY